MNSKLVSLSVASVLGFASSVASAQVLMLNFGPAAGGSSVTNNSPYHTAAGSGFTQTHWNTVGTADITAPSSFLFSDGLTAASGVSVNLGISTTSTINLSSQPGTSSALGTASNADIYLNNDIAKSGIFSGTASSNNSVGLQIGGMTAGTYDIYVTARNTNTGFATNNGYSQTVLVGTSAASGNFNFSGYSAGTLTYPSSSNPTLYSTAWVEGENYVKLSISLAAGQFLNLAVDGTAIGSSGDTRGFLNSVQIVNTTIVPEPSSFAALAGLGALGLVGLRRRSRR